MEKDRVLTEIREAIELNRTVKQKNNDALSHAEYLLKNDDEYNRGLNDAWELAKKLWLPTCRGGINVEIIEKIFECDYFDISKHFTPQEALAKIESYEKEQEEIKVGDVVTFGKNLNEKFLVIADDNEFVWAYSRESSVQNIHKTELHKTGKHIDISAILSEVN